MTLLKDFLVALLAVCLGSSAYCQTPPWNGVLDPSRAVDWSHAGASIATTRTQCATSACSAVSSGTSVTAASINAALASASQNSYVLIPAGTFTMSTGLTFNGRSNVTLRGSGSNSTFLVWSSASGGSGSCGGHDICAGSSDVNYAGGPSNAANWTGTNDTSGTYTKGATSIFLDSKSNLTVGSQLILDQVDTQKDNGGLYVGCEIADGSTACYSGTGPNGFERGSGALNTIRGQQQIVNVTSISGTGPYTIGITPGIYASNWATANSPGAWWATNPLAGDAVENISLDHTNGGDGITFFNCTGCWVKGIRSVRNSVTGTAWGHVNLSICNHCTVRDSYFYGYSGDSYGISVEIASDALVENNIFHYFISSQFYNSDCEGCVADYNFVAGANFGSSGSSWMGNSAEFHGTVLYALSEGNIGTGLYGDSFHGTQDLDTAFRNRWDGREQNQGTPASSNTVPLRLNSGVRYYNAIGNVLGTPGYHTSYKSLPPGNGLYTSILGLGAYPEANTNDPLTAPTSMFWGNWDSVTKAVRWCGNSSNPGWSTTCGSASEVPANLSSYSNPIPSNTNLPASFIYSARPSWWPSGKAWPAIGPDVASGNVGQCSGGVFDTSEAISSGQCSGGKLTPNSMVTSIPAMDCYFNAMHGVANGSGSALSFDANVCYQTGTSVAPGTPQSLSGTVIR